MTVERFRVECSAEEFEDWLDFCAMYPIDDFHRFHRPAALTSLGISGGDISRRLEWLQPTPKGDYSDSDFSVFKALGVTPPRG